MGISNSLDLTSPSKRCSVQARAPIQLFLRTFGLSKSKVQDRHFLKEDRWQLVTNEARSEGGICTTLTALVTCCVKGQRHERGPSVPYFTSSCGRKGALIAQKRYAPGVEELLVFW